MAISVVMPALEMAQETGKLISWFKKEGDSITKGEPLLEIETDKAVMEIEAPADGVLAGVKAQAGAEVPVGQTIAWIVGPGEEPPTEEVAATSGRKSTVAPAATGGDKSTASKSEKAAGSMAAQTAKIYLKPGDWRPSRESILPMFRAPAQGERFLPPIFLRRPKRNLVPQRQRRRRHTPVRLRA